MDPVQLLPYFQLVGQVALVVAAAFAGYQFVQLQRNRREAAALQVVTNLQDAAFRAAYSTVWILPLGSTAQDVKRHGPQMEDAAATVMMAFETLGVLVYNRIVPVETVDQVLGGFLRESWRRLEGYVHEKRAEVGSRRWGEWYQWLFEHLSTNPRRGEGAYEAFKDWRP